MKNFVNERFEVNFTDENNFTVKNVFGEVYRCWLDANKKVVTKNKFGLEYALRAREDFGF